MSRNCQKCTDAHAYIQWKSPIVTITSKALKDAIPHQRYIGKWLTSLNCIDLIKGDADFNLLGIPLMLLYSVGFVYLKGQQKVVSEISRARVTLKDGLLKN